MRKVKWCKYFWTKTGCDKEDRCGYMHSYGDYNTPAPARKDQKPVCGEYRSAGFCTRGDRCSLGKFIGSLRPETNISSHGSQVSIAKGGVHVSPRPAAPGPGPKPPARRAPGPRVPAPGP